MTMFTRRLALVVLFIAGCGIAIGLAEGIVRLIDPHARDHVIPGLFVMDATLGWRLQPNTTVTHQTRYFTASYTTNAWGYRDQPRTINKNADRTRILFYGDSQIFGWGIPDMLRFSDLLEAQHPALEVWNLAVPGHGLDQQLIAYEQKGQGWDADVVIFFLTRATLKRVDEAYLYQKYKPRFVLDRSGTLQLIPVPQQGTTWTTLFYRVLRPWYLPYFMERQLATITEMLNRTSQDDPPLDALTQALLERAAQVARVRGHQLILLTTLPLLTRQALQNFAAHRGIRVMTVEFRGQYKSFIFGKHDPHWNPRAHRWITEQFWEQWAIQDGKTVIQ